ncbi:protein NONRESPONDING TO OXYLIPINS 2, mitochondrial-like [Quercus robur]|uniref:protein NONRESPONDING TO OXYLIPINS 2, mitochondrial-like n=1 Tax=Quercus robur TaxID=38942 RepID=UPI00216313CF|nr:protein NONRESPONDING TO OXYLIPINS 2, mitochondrial-like [Quercus robur]
MAYSNVVSRLSSRLQPFALKLAKRSLAPELSPLKSCSQSQSQSQASASASAGRFSRISRLPLELSSVETMIPLHNAIASARLVSSLSTDSQSWSLVPQGISMPL